MSFAENSQQSMQNIAVNETHPRRGLVLSGGGALAAYEVGVMKALLTGQSEGTGHKLVDIDIVTGTSAGSVNAGLFLSAADQGVSNAAQYLEHVWLTDIGDLPGRCAEGAFRFRCNPSMFFNPACYSADFLGPLSDFLSDSVFVANDWVKRGTNFLLSKEGLEQRALELVNLSTLISRDGFNKLLVKKIQLDKIRSSHIMLRIAATNWKTGQLKIFHNSDMTEQNGTDIILASAAIPGVFDPVNVGGESYIDGGAVLNTPLKPAIDAGADQLHVIYMDPETAHLHLPPLENTASALYRTLLIAFGATIKRDINTARVINHGIDLAKRSANHSTKSMPEVSIREARLAANELLRSEAGQPHRPLTIHIYHPYQSLGAGWFAFSREHLQNLINHGFQDALDHNCKRDRCVLPG